MDILKFINVKGNCDLKNLPTPCNDPLHSILKSLKFPKPSRSYSLNISADKFATVDDIKYVLKRSLEFIASENLTSNNLLQIKQPLHDIYLVLKFNNTDKNDLLAIAFTFLLKEFINCIKTPTTMELFARTEELIHSITTEIFNICVICSSKQIACYSKLSDTFMDYLELLHLQNYETLCQDIAQSINKPNFFPLGENARFYNILDRLLENLSSHSIYILQQCARSNDNYITSIENRFIDLAKLAHQKLQSAKTAPFINIKPNPNFNLIEKDFHICSYIDYEQFNYYEDQLDDWFALCQTMNKPDYYFYPEITIEFDYEILNDINPKYISKFIESFIKNDSNDNEDSKDKLTKFSIVLHILLHMKNYQLTNDDTSLIEWMNEIVINFDYQPDFIFKGDIDSRLILHYLFFKLISIQTNYNQRINLLFKRIVIKTDSLSSQSVLLFCEFLLQILSQSKPIKLIDLCNNEMIRYLNDCFQILKRMKSEHVGDRINIARTISLKFLFSLIEDPQCFTILKQSVDFANGFNTLFYDTNIYSMLIDKLQTALLGNSAKQESQNYYFTAFSSLYSKIINDCTTNSDYFRNNLSIKIIKSISEIIDKDYHYLISFQNTFHYILSFFDKIIPSLGHTSALNVASNISNNSNEQTVKQSNISENSIHNIIFLFLFASIQFKDFDYLEINDHFSLLCNIFRNIQFKEEIEQVILSFHKLISETNLKSRDTLFICKYPRFIPLYFVIYTRYAPFDRIIKFFIELSNYSFRNCVAFHTSHFDLLLLHFLNGEHVFTYKKNESQI